MKPIEKLQQLLRDLFQFDLSDLDFGIYRLLRLKRGEIEEFLTEQLPRRVNEVFAGSAAEEQKRIQEELKELAEKIKQDIDEDALLSTGEVKPEFQDIKGKKNQKLLTEYKEKRAQASASEATEEQRAEVFNHLYAFFSRYYDDGDFIPKRRYGSRETYAVPYSGEETYFHWTNKDQHYVKTAENFRDYSFTVEAMGKRYSVRFVLTEASVPPGNTKGDTRFFFPQPDEATFEKNTQTFKLPFHYRLPTESEIEKLGKNNKLQEILLQKDLKRILKSVADESLRGGLSEIVDRKENEDVPLLLKRIRHFCKRNTSDFFVHKDLEGFLRRELEFYLKDQLLHLVDLESAFVSKQQTLRVMRTLAEEIIRFVSQIENVQKRLFEKKKFVMRTDYLIPIQSVPKLLWKEVLANKEQLEEWRKLYSLDPKESLFTRKGELNEHFLEGLWTLVVDTSHFDTDFTLKLVAAFDNLDEITDGLLIQAENYQALRLLQRKYEGKVKCIYIDPPYNTGDSEIPYKNGYLFSSWLSLMHQRLVTSARLLSSDAVLFIAIDDFELADLCELVDTYLPTVKREMIVVNHHPQGGKARALASTHEYMLACITISSERSLVGRATKDGIEERPFRRSGTAESNFRYGRPNSFYAVLVDPKTLKVVGAEQPPAMGTSYSTKPTKEGWLRIFPVTSNGEERVWRRSYESGVTLIEARKLACSENLTIYQLIDAGERNSALFSNWIDPRYNAGTYGANLLRDIIGEQNPFSYPKSVHTVEDAMFAAGLEDDDICLDYFAGSGTTGHAVINLNREDGGRRKFVCVEMANYFDSVLIPRVKKVVFTPEWKDGKPVRNATKEEAERSPRLVKILRLESYEDSLHNLVADETLRYDQKGGTVVKGRVGGDKYRVLYLAKLAFEANASMLNVQKLEHPFRYTIESLTEDGPKLQSVDLVETFDLLFPLEVHQMETWTNAKDKREYRSVKGKTSEGRRMLAVWRDMENLDPLVEREFLEAKVKSVGPFDEMLINGDTATPGFVSLDPIFKRLIEEEER